MIDPATQLVVTLALALLFAAAAWHKWRAGPRFVAQLAEYDILPAAMAGIGARLLMGLEGLLVLALLWPVTRSGAAVFAGALLVGYAGAMAVNIARGRTHIDCGCGDTPQLLSHWLVLRNTLLALVAVYAGMPLQERPLGALDAVLVMLGCAALVVAYAALEQLLANASVLGEWRLARQQAEVSDD